MIATVLKQNISSVWEQKLFKPVHSFSHSSICQSREFYPNLEQLTWTFKIDLI